MLWFKNNYSPKPEDWKKWDNSPIFASEESFKLVPDAWIGVAELDILRDEGLAYAEKLKKAGHKVETIIYKGSPHPIMAMDGKLVILWSFLFIYIHQFFFFILPWITKGWAVVLLYTQLIVTEYFVFVYSVLKSGRQLIADAADALDRAFNKA